MKDEEIVELYWQRSELAISRTKAAYGKLIRGIAHNVLFNLSDCEEVENDTYLAAWNSMPEHRPPVLGTYLGRIARQDAIDIYRKQHSKKRKGSEFALSITELDEVLPGGDRPEEALDSKELNQAINTFLRTLDEKHCSIFLGRYFYFDSIRKIAGYSDMPEATVKTILRRTRLKLKEYLEQQGYSI